MVVAMVDTILVLNITPADTTEEGVRMKLNMDAEE